MAESSEKRTPDLTSQSRAPKDAHMGNELISLNHLPCNKSTYHQSCESEVEISLERACAQARAALDPIGAGDAVLLSRAVWQSLSERHYPSRPDEADSVRIPPNLWTVKQMAKQLGLSTDYVYRHAADWPFTVRLNGSHGRGSDLRFIASEAAQWLNRKRAKR
jgi:hypothetical protein